MTLRPPPHPPPPSSAPPTVPESPNRENLNHEPKEPAPAEPPYSTFSRRQKWLIVALASVSATFTGFASNIYFPAIPKIARDVNSTVENINLTVTSYLIFQAISPTLWGYVDVK